MSNKTGRKRVVAFHIGQVLENCTIVERADALSGDGYARTGYICECRCGRRFRITDMGLRGRPLAACRSCGSRRGAESRPAPKMSTHPLYSVWRSMLQRCENPEAQAYYNYGARGITVCAEWQSLVCFIWDMGECPPGLTLERRDNEKGYNPNNCYWATAAEQNVNTRVNRHITIDGVRKTLSQWAQALGTGWSTVANRMARHGWSERDACTTPVRAKNKNGAGRAKK